MSATMEAPTTLERNDHVPRRRKPGLVDIPKRSYDNMPSASSTMLTSGNETGQDPTDLMLANQSNIIRIRSARALEHLGTEGTSHEMESPTGNQSTVIDPISRQILARTVSQHRVSSNHHGTSGPHGNSVLPEESKLIGRQPTGLTDTDPLRRTDSLLSNKGTKEKKKGFLSRILGGKNKDEPADLVDNASELMDSREPGTSAEVFSQPMGYVPRFPVPPRYIRVKTQNRKKRDLDRLFLAQILSEGAARSRKASDELDAKIHGINDRPVLPPHNSTRTKNNAIWAAEISRDGQYYAAGGQDKKLKVWRILSSREDCESGQDEDGNNVKLNAPVFKQELVREYEGHTAAILDLSWSKNNFLLSSSMDKTVRLYHISRPECLCAFKHSDFVTSIAFHPRDDRFFLAGSLDSKIRLWSIPDKSIAYWAPVHDMVTAVAFTPDGKTAIAGTLSGLCTLHDTEGLKAHSQIHVRSNRGKNAKGSKITGIETIQVARQDGPPDVKLLITSNDSRVRLYNLRDKMLEIKFRGHENATSQIRASFSDDGRFVICGSEDKRVYVWPTGPVERQDLDKRPVEVFEAHTSIVTTALILPTTSRRLLARSGDPIYDLCNPPPVRLLSRTESALSSAPATETSGLVDHHQRNTDSAQRPTDESPQYAARNSHNAGLIIVTGDFTGELKVFRQDCAYNKRKEGVWDNASFSRMLGRNGSVATRVSERSSTYRKSMTFGDSRNPPSRDIINWRNSVMSAKSTGAATSTSDVAPSESHTTSSQEERDRSASPMSRKRGLSHRFSRRHGSTPLANASRPSTDESQRLQTPQQATFDRQRLSDATVNGDGVSSPKYYTASKADQRRSPFINDEHSKRQTVNIPNMQGMSRSVPDISLTNASPIAEHEQQKADQSNGLFLVDNQSYMAYDVQHTMVPMAQAQPRTPAANSQLDPLARQQSIVSTLSSERGSSASAPLSERRQSTGLGINGTGASDNEKSEGEELRCKKCGNETFAMVRHGGNAHRLKCRKCGDVVPDD